MGRLTLLLLLALVFGCDRPASPDVIASKTTIAGTVVERVDGPPYSFLRLGTEDGQVWVAVPMVPVERKTRITVKKGAVVRNFESKQAGRKFEMVVFGVVEKGYTASP